MSKDLVFLKKLREDLKPKKGFLNEVNKMIDSFNSVIKELDIKAVCVAGGSVAKGTLIKNDYDADLFVRFDYETYENKDISKELEKILKKSKLKYEMVHGSRDYFQVNMKKLTYEFVPVLEIDDFEDALNVTDMSPLHVKWLKDNSNNKMIDDIRLAKQFCKANELYGAESFIGGFSGHIIDIMIVHYSSFIDLLKASKEWDDKVVIDIENHLDDPLNELNSSKIECPMVIVDPVQPERNAAAALGFEKFEMFKKKAKEFLKNPDKSFFKKKEFKIEDIKKKKIESAKFFGFKVTPLVGKTDIVGAKLLKAHNHIIKELKLKDFTVIDSGWNWDKDKICYFYYFIKDEKLSDTVKQRGPPVDAIVDAARFQNKHETINIKNNRMYADIKRKYTKAEKLLSDLMKSDYIKERTKRIVKLK